MLKKSSRWKHGEKVEMAKRAGISKQHINGIFNCGLALSRPFARKLFIIAQDMGKDITYLDIIDNDITSNPLFRNPNAMQN